MKIVDYFVSGPYWNATVYEQNECYNNLQFLIFWSDDINHSNFEDANKCLIKSWWYLHLVLKHVCFYNKNSRNCDTCVHFQWKKTNLCLSTRSGCCQRCACVVCMTSAISWTHNSENWECAWYQVINMQYSFVNF